MKKYNASVLRQSAKRWLIFFAFVMLISFGLLVYRLVDLQVVRHDQLRGWASTNIVRTTVLEARRGNILDRRGNLLATSLFVKTVCADPSIIGSYQTQIAHAIAPLLEMNEEVLREKLTPKLFENDQGQMRTNRYVVLRRKVPRKRWEMIRAALEGMELGEKENGVSRRQKQFLRRVRKAVFADEAEDQLRVYQSKRLASHVMGFVSGSDHKGREGIEAVLDSKLTGTAGWRVTEADAKNRELVWARRQFVAPRNGLNVMLTLDSVVQHIVEEELEKAVAKHKPAGITVIVVQPKTGAILALANRPDFDPNRPGEFHAAYRRNRAVTDTMEPGSTFKIVTVAAAIQDRVVTLNSIFDCERGSFFYGGRRLRDHHPYGSLSVEKIITKSSNIGIAKIGIRVGAARLHHYLLEFGFGQRTRVSLPGEVRGTVHPLKKWNKLSITRVPMGHEVAVTPMQMVMMLSAVANGGKLMQPMLLDSLRDESGRVVVKYHPKAIRQVISPDTARKVTVALKTVVGEGGTARRAKLQYYSVAGKTGTAQKAGLGGYIDGKFYSSFIGFFPADKPALCIFVGLDEPTGDYYGGLTAAPIFKAIAERTASYLVIKPDLVEQGSLVSRREGR
jgi:cell division protein FtsI/penicillin-binding protein 2